MYRQREIPDTFYNRAQSLSFLPLAVDETLRYGTTIFNKKRNLAGWQLGDRSPSPGWWATDGMWWRRSLTASQLMLSQRLPPSFPQHAGYDRTTQTQCMCAAGRWLQTRGNDILMHSLLIWKDQWRLNIDWVVHDESYTDGS